MILLSLPACVPVVPEDAVAQSPARETIASDSVAEASPIDTYIADAAGRFDIPEPWIRAVMQVESAGDPRAVSSAGAMGLMQIMPATWNDLRDQLDLGTNAFDPRDNVLAGTAYLRMMHDRFGSPGFLAAYNAGPERYADHLRTGRQLPRETRLYVASLLPLIDASDAEPMQPKTPPPNSDWREAPLFAGKPDRDQADPRGSDAASRDGLTIGKPVARQSIARAVPDGLFVRPRPEESE
ncbi:lytic transglycosylase domain-containing protein [Maribius pontilimi]|uniref:Lytic transglycosylase domain-containing protein n=2 Tax=Palleronia pontilimi TaxID=1964209 RepID=A0A934MBB3_9RHOB|nr:lytic transglycosylase domain-containing protein [Palleronia pontilimi]